VQGTCDDITGCRGTRLLVWLILNDRVQPSFIAGVYCQIERGGALSSVRRASTPAERRPAEPYPLPSPGSGWLLRSSTVQHRPCSLFVQLIEHLGHACAIITQIHCETPYSAWVDWIDA
jgi:hypothetical protein